MARAQWPLRLFGVLDEDWVPESLDLTYSSWTEADPRPGTATTTAEYPKLDPAIVGAQSDGAVIAVLQSGYPKAGGAGLGIGYYLNDGVETISDARGFQAPTFFSDYQFWQFYGFDTYYSGLGFCPLTGVIASYAGYFDPHTQSWGTISGAGDVSVGSAVAFVPGTPRALLITSEAVRISDDLASWTTVATTGPSDVSSGTPTYSTAALSKFRAAFDGSGNLLYVAEDSSGDPTVDFYASDDGGGSWVEVERMNPSGANVYSFDISAHPDGWIALVYEDPDANAVYFVRLNSAFDVPTSLGKVEIGSGLTPSDVAVVCDTNGAIWVYLQEAGAPPSTCFVYFSTDAGVTWTRASDLWYRGTAEDILSMTLVPHPFGGVAGVIHTSGGGGYVQLGGWSGPGRDGNDWATSGGGRADAHWIGADDPVEHGYAKTGTATESLVTSGGTAPHGYWRVQSTGAALQGYWGVEVHTSARRQAAAEWIVRIVEDGGTATAITSGIAVSLQSRDNAGVKQYTIQVRLDEAGWRLYDVEAAGWESNKVLIDLTTRTHFRVSFEEVSGVVTWEVATRKDYQTKWTRTTGSTLTAGAPASDGVTNRFGHLTGVANTESHWWRVAARGVSAPGLVGTLNNGIGAMSYPIPDVHDATRERLAYLRIRGGPAYTGEEYTIEPRYGFPLSATFPTREPSPDRRWRSTATGVEQLVVIDKGVDTDLGRTMVTVLVVKNANFRSANLVVQTGGGGFNTIASIDLSTGFVNLGYALTGNRLVPDVGGDIGARYVQKNELKGGHVVFDPTGTPTYVRIIGNTGGWYDPASTSTQVSIYLDPDQLAVAAPAANGTCDLVWSSGVLVVYSPLVQGVFEQWGWQIDAATGAPEAYYEAGIIALMGGVGLGKSFGDGYQWGETHNVRVAEDSYGTQRRQQRGPSRRTLTVSWDHMVDLYQIRKSAGAGNFIAPDDINAVVQQDDVWMQLRGAMVDAKGGELPVVLILKDPPEGDGENAASETITDPTLWIYGYVEGEHGFEQTLGDDADGELGRVRPLRIVEAV
jgi:hypothetical protein